MEKKIKTTEIISWIIVVILCIGYGVLCGFAIKSKLWLTFGIGLLIGFCIGYFRALIVERISDNIVRKHMMMKNNQMHKSYL